MNARTHNSPADSTMDESICALTRVQIIAFIPTEWSFRRKGRWDEVESSVSSSMSGSDSRSDYSTSSSEDRDRIRRREARYETRPSRVMMMRSFRRISKQVRFTHTGLDWTLCLGTPPPFDEHRRPLRKKKKCFEGTCPRKCCKVFCALVVTVKTCKKVVNFFEEKSASLRKTCVLRATTEKGRHFFASLNLSPWKKSCWRP